MNKEEILSNIENACKEAKLIREGKMKPITVEEVMDSLSENEESKAEDISDLFGMIDITSEEPLDELRSRALRDKYKLQHTF